MVNVNTPSLLTQNNGFSAFEAGNPDGEQIKVALKPLHLATRPPRIDLDRLRASDETNQRLEKNATKRTRRRPERKVPVERKF